MGPEIPANSGFGVIFDYGKLSAQFQHTFKGFGFTELFDGPQGFMQKISLPNLTESIKMPALLVGKIPGILSGKGGGKNMGG
jgi:hypothetical protein